MSLFCGCMVTVYSAIREPENNMHQISSLQKPPALPINTHLPSIMSRTMTELVFLSNTKPNPSTQTLTTPIHPQQQQIYLKKMEFDVRTPPPLPPITEHCGAMDALSKTVF